MVDLKKKRRESQENFEVQLEVRSENERPEFPEGMMVELLATDMLPRGVLRVRNATLYIIEMTECDFQRISSMNARIRYQEMSFGQRTRTLRLVADVTEPNGYILIRAEDEVILYPWDGECVRMSVEEYLNAVENGEYIGSEALVELDAE